MQRYRVRENLDEYEDEMEDRCEDDEEDQYEEEDEEEEEEKEQPRREEEIRYLELREKLKAKHRSNLRRENGKNGANVDPRKLIKFDFFGPSKPAIAERVIQERKSLLETRHLAPKVSTSQNDVKKVNTSSSIVSKNGSNNKPLPRQVKSKAQIIKQTRDYSWLMSEDADVPKPAKDPGSRKSLPSKPVSENGRSAQVQAKRFESSSHSAKRPAQVQAKHDVREQRKPSSAISQVHEQRRPSSSTSQVHEQRKPSSSISQVHEQRKPSSISQVHEQRKPSSSISQVRDDRRAPPQRSGSSDSRRQLELRKQSLPNKQVGNNSGSGSRSSVQKILTPKKPLSSVKKMAVGSVERKLSGTPVGNRAPGVAKTSTFDRQRPPMVKSQASGVNNHMEHRRDVQRSSENKSFRKENVAAPKSQISKPPNQPYRQSNLENGHHVKQKPTAQLQRPSVANNRDHKIKKRKSPDSDSEPDYRSLIRNMFRYDPGRYRDEDDDDRCMEATFEDIDREERRSAKIAKQEDDEEFIKIQEEERREREAALRRKRKKLNHR